MDENYPIDIHYNKLLGESLLFPFHLPPPPIPSPPDWLVSRRHCDSKWHVQSKVIRSKVAAAIKDLPHENEELAKILRDETCMWVWLVSTCD